MSEFIYLLPDFFTKNWSLEKVFENLDSGLDYSLFCLPVQNGHYDFFILYQNYFFKKVIHLSSGSDVKNYKQIFESMMIEFHSIPNLLPEKYLEIFNIKPDQATRLKQIWNQLLLVIFMTNAKQIFPRFWTLDDLQKFVKNVEPSVLLHFITEMYDRLSKGLKKINS